jgi:hypothetical protein
MIPETCLGLSQDRLAQAFVEAMLAMETPPIAVATSGEAIDLVNVMAKRVNYLRKKQFEARRYAMTKAATELLTELFGCSFDAKPEPNTEQNELDNPVDRKDLENMTEQNTEHAPDAATGPLGGDADYDQFVSQLTSRPSYGAILARLGTNPGESIEDFVGLGDGFDFMESIGKTGDLMHAALGMSTEVGEMLHGASVPDPVNFDRINAIEELGDLEFYASLARQAIGMTRVEIVAGAAMFSFYEVVDPPSDPLAMMQAYKEAIGSLVIETSELLDLVKKNLFYARPISVDKAAGVLGQIEFYMGMCRKILGVERETVIERNVAKLKKRYGSAFSAAKANDRDLAGERVALEGGQS